MELPIDKSHGVYLGTPEWQSVLAAKSMASGAVAGDL